MWKKAFTIKPNASEEFFTILKIEGKEICVVKTINKIHAFQNRCPHAGGSLGSGWLQDGMIVCPNHHFRYALETGKGQGTQGDFINIYETKTIENQVYINLPPSLNPIRWLKKLFD